jgi:hypothetical protein
MYEITTALGKRIPKLRSMYGSFVYLHVERIGAKMSAKHKTISNS